MLSHLRILCLCGLALALAPCLAYAAPPSPVLPGSADVGRVLQDMKVLPQPAISIPAVIAPSATESPTAVDDKTTVMIKSITIEGVTVYDPKIFARLYQPYLNQYDSLGVLYRIVAAITQRYHDDGYALSVAVLPPQDITDGHVKILVIEGSITRVETQGKYRESPVTREIIDRIEHYRPVNMHDLERDVLLLNDLAGVSVQAVFEPHEDDDPPGSNGMLLVFTDVPYASTLSADNLGSRYVGPYQFTAATGINSLFQPYSQTSFSGLGTSPVSNLQYFSLSHRTPLDGEGTALTLLGNYAHSEPGFTLIPEDIVSNSINYGFSLSHPFIRTRAQNLTVSTDFTVKDTRTEALSSKLYEDRTRVISLSGNYTLVDGWAGSNLAQATLAQGLNLPGVTKTGTADLSRADGHSDFTKIDSTLSRLQALGGPLQLYAAATGQYAWSPLLSSEQFGFGGQQFGRGYDASEITADDGIAGSVELRYGLPPPTPKMSAEAFAFYDRGWLWDYGQGADTREAASAGFGIRFGIDPFLTGNLYVAEPMIRRNDAPPYGKGKDPRVFLSITAHF